jgi:hypothetical protein
MEDIKLIMDTPASNIVQRSVIVMDGDMETYMESHMDDSVSSSLRVLLLLQAFKLC